MGKRAQAATRSYKAVYVANNVAKVVKSVEGVVEMVVVVGRDSALETPTMHC